MNIDKINNWEYKWFGFWGEEGDNVDPLFSHLPFVGDFIDIEWKPKKLEKIINYLNNPAWTLVSPGETTCELCNTSLPASSFFSDGIWLWPEDLVHYITEHHLRLPKAFEEHIVENNYTPPKNVEVKDEDLPWPF